MIKPGLLIWVQKIRKETDCGSQQFAMDKILSTLWSQIVTQMFQW